MTIGERAAQAIHERAEDLGISPAKVMESMGANRKTLGDLGEKKPEPTSVLVATVSSGGL